MRGANLGGMAQTGIAHDALHILAGAAWLGGSLWILGLAFGVAVLAACRLAARINVNGRTRANVRNANDIQRAGAAKPAVTGQADEPVQAAIP